MLITVNGEELALDEACTVRDLLARYRLVETPCAVEVNTTLVPHRAHETHELNDGDAVEIVTLVGGG